MTVHQHILDPDYEYAGFRYRIVLSSGMVTATALEGQHSAASRERHMRAAVECYNADQAKLKS